MPLPFVKDTLQTDVTDALEGLGGISRMAAFSTWNAPTYTSFTRSTLNWNVLLTCDQSPFSSSDTAKSHTQFFNYTCLYNENDGAVWATTVHESGLSSGDITATQHLSPYSTQTQTITGSARVGQTDILLVKTPKFTNSVTAALVPPINFRDYLPTWLSSGDSGTFHAGGIPGTVYDKDNNTLAVWIWGDDPTAVNSQDSSNGLGVVWAQAPQDADLLAMYQTAVSGDSSGAMATPWQPANKMIYWGPVFTGWGASSIADNYAAVLTAGQSLVSGFVLSPVDWSGYNDGTSDSAIIGRVRIRPAIGGRFRVNPVRNALARN